MLATKKYLLVGAALLLSVVLEAQWAPRSVNYQQVRRHDFFNPLRIHFSDTSNGFILNSDELMRYRSGRWFPVNTGNPLDFSYVDVFTVNPRNTFLCSSDGRIARWSQSSNLQVIDTLYRQNGFPAVFHTIWMNDSLRGWTAGDTGILVRINGNNISLTQLNTNHHFRDICFDAPDHGWMIGYTMSGPDNVGVVYEYTGGQWVFSTLIDEYLYDVEFSSPGNGFIAGENALYRYNPVNRQWIAEIIPNYQRQLSISMLNDQYGISVSNNNSVLVYQNGSWQNGPAPTGITDLVSVKVTGAGKAWAISQYGTNNTADYNEGKIQVMNNNSWSSLNLSYLNNVTVFPVNYAITNITGIGKRDIWLNGQYLGIPAGSNWPSGIPVLQSDTFCNAARLFSKQFGLGTDGDLKEWNGQFWFNKKLDAANPDTSYTNLTMQVFDDTTAFVCRQRLVWASGAILNQVSNYIHRSNTITNTFPIGTKYPFDIEFTGSRHGWIVGDSGLTVRFRNGSWQTLPAVTNNRLSAVAMPDSLSAWAVGDGGTLLRFNGSNWVAHPLPTSQNLYSIQFVGSRGWITGDSGLIFSYNGTQWIKESSGTTKPLYCIYMTDSTWGFAGGGDGLLLQYLSPAASLPRQFCEYGNTFYTYRPSAGSGYTFQWQVNTGNGYTNILPSPNFSGMQSDTLRVLNMPPYFSGYKFRCVANRNGVDSVSNEETLRFINRWIGGPGNAWETAANWSCGSVPGTETEVEVDAGEVFINSQVRIRSITLKPGVQLTIRSGGTLTLLR